ncbi:MAG: nucleoside:proton symporter [Gammaproteobacteria bacterium]|nr:nucleoside:proton symporter [Gammaproteobacteria bacterium]
MIYQAYVGIVALLVIAWALSEDRSVMNWRMVAVGLGLQIGIAFVLIRAPVVAEALFVINYAVIAIETATTAGAGFVFGFLGGGEVPFEITADNAMYIFAFRILPQILVFSVLVAIFWHWGVLPVIVRGFGWALRRSMGVGGSVGVAAAASIFLGMVEAPLVIRAYLRNISRSELFTVMTCGMATVAGSVMILFANLLSGVVENPLGHVLVASLISIPAALMVARIMVPGTTTTEGVDLADALRYESTIDAVTRGTADGLKLIGNILAMLIVLISLVALVNLALGALPDLGGEALTLQRILGWLFAPIAWLMGIPWHEATTAGSLLGTKVILNELVAYIDMAALPVDALGPRSDIIMTYALCGFANFGSLGIMIGGISALCPERRMDILALAPRTLVSGTIVTCMTGAVVGIVY